MKSNKIVVHFTRIENVLIAKLVKFPEDLRGRSIIIEGGGYSISSMAYTDISRYCLFLSGMAGRKEVLAAHAYKDEIEAKKALENFKHLIHKYNSCCEKDDTTIAWERAQ